MCDHIYNSSLGLCLISVGRLIIPFSVQCLKCLVFSIHFSVHSVPCSKCSLFKCSLYLPFQDRSAKKQILFFKKNYFSQTWDWLNSKVNDYNYNYFFMNKLQLLITIYSNVINYNYWLLFDILIKNIVVKFKIKVY